MIRNNLVFTPIHHFPMKRSTFIGLRHLLTLLLVSCFLNITFAQVIEIQDTQNPPYTVDNLITDVLLGEGVQITDIDFQGSESAVGFFKNAINDIGIDRGIIMTTGNAKTRNASLGADNPASVNSDDDNGSTASDDDINDLAESNIFNLSKYEITFIPSADTLRFRYVFASEEYPEFACRNFNDIFGFFITGPNPNGGSYNSQNLAIVPGSNLPVAINSVHSTNPDDASCQPINEMFYNDNSSSTNLVYDAYLDVFFAEAVVVPCEEYSIKLVIADQGDSQYDSAVFLEAKSFSAKLMVAEVETTGIDGAAAEGCGSAEVTFTLPFDNDADFVVNYDIIGTAQNGIDYENIPNTVTIPAGSNQTSLFINPIEDNMSEPLETVGLVIHQNACTVDTVWVSIKDNELMPPILQDTIIVCDTDESIAFDATVNITIPEPPTFRNTTPSIIFPVDQAIYSPIEVSGISPLNLTAEIIDQVCIDSLVHPWIEDLDIFLVSPSGTFIELTTDNGSDGGNGTGDDLYLNTCFTPVASQAIVPNNQTEAPASAVPFTGQFLPEGYIEDLFDGNTKSNGTWQLLLIDDTPTAVGQLFSWSISFNSTYDISYSWSPTNGLSCSDCPNPTLNPDVTTTYVVTVTDTYGCTVTDSTTVIVVEDLTTPNISCNNSVTGEISFDWEAVDNAIGYEVNVNGTGWIVPNMPPNAHTVDGLGLGETVTLEVRAVGQCGEGPASSLECTSINCLPSTSQVDEINNVSCPDSEDGSVRISTTGGTAPFSYTLDEETNTAGIFENLAIGAYTIEIIDDLGCISTLDFEVAAPDSIVSNGLILNAVSCPNIPDGSVTVEVSGGQAPYQFEWNNMTTDSINTDIIAGEYIVTISDNNNCQHIDTVTLATPFPIEIDSIITPLTCFNGSNASIEITATGGSGVLNYLWNTGEMTNQIENISSGNYILTITDEAGCSEIENYEISNPEGLMIAKDSTDATCFNTSDGSVSITVSGGTVTDSYQYLWSNDSTTSSIVNLEPNLYMVTVTDDNGCSMMESVTVNSPPAITFVIDSTDISCFGLADGTATVIGNGGTGVLSYEWNVGTDQNNISSLSSGAYEVTITDSNDCAAIASTFINEPTEITAQANLTSVECNGEENGSIDLSATGGTGDYTYNWSENSISEDISGLSPGNYIVTITDTNNCSIDTSFNITQSTIIESSFDVENVGCFGESTGSIFATVEGGALPYEYNWSNGSNTANILDVTGGVYNLTITDANNCETVEEVIIEEPEGIIEGIVDVSDISCFGASNGALTINVTGGTSPYLYSMNGEDFGTSNTFIGLDANDYILFVEDMNGCVASLPSSIVLENPEEIIVDLGENKNIPLGNSVVIEPIIENTIGQVNYTWVTSDTSTISCMNCSNPEILAQNSQTYELIVTDENGCTGSDFINLIINSQINVLVPTGFTPNGDNLNDLLHVHGESNKIDQVNYFRIYDRWGSLVHETGGFGINDLAVGWDGTYKGKALPSGVFAWYIEVLLIDGTTRQFKGETTLFR